jgi:hypothetical protein
MNNAQKTARSAGLFYLLIAIIAPFGLMYVPLQIIEWGDAAATANNMLGKELLFRSGIAVRMVAQVLMILVVWFLYRLLKEVDENQAKLMFILYLVAVPIGFLANVFNFTALMVLKGSAIQSFTPEQMNDLALLFLRIGSWDTEMVQLYWGLWLLPFGFLVYKSGFIPRILGIFLILNGIAYMISSFTCVLFPEYRSLVSRIAMPFFFLGEIPIIFWLLIKGVRVKQLAEPDV